MIRGWPSISTTGIAGRLDGAEVRHQVGLARGAQQLFALVAADLGEDVYRGGHIGWSPRWQSRSGPWRPGAS